MGEKKVDGINIEMPLQVLIQFLLLYLYDESLFKFMNLNEFKKICC